MPEISSSAVLTTSNFDVIIIGSGVVGCAMARRFTLEGANVLVVEKAVDILDGASKANSAILHTGFDAPASGSQELQCITEGYREYLDIHARLKLPLLNCGALVLAWNEAEAARLESILTAAHQNGIVQTQLISAKKALQIEPELAQTVQAAIHVPGESVIDPWSAPYAYLLQALQNGASLIRNCEVQGGSFDGQQWLLNSSRGKIRGKRVINCAGLYGDRLNQALIGESSFEIRTRKGQFVVFDKSARSLTYSILLPVPNEITKGIVVCPTIFGNLLVGPTAEEQQSRTDSSVQADTLKALQARGQQILPGLKRHAITATYAGLRPASEHKDYQIKWYRNKNYCCVGGIRSTGLSAALGIATYVYRGYENAGDRHATLESAIWPTAPQISECAPRDWQQAGNDGIVCHCELVSRREIKQALQGPIPVQSLAGLKRRTRATMGRCQGFYCSAELSELSDGYFQLPMSCAIDDQ